VPVMLVLTAETSTLPLWSTVRERAFCEMEQEWTGSMPQLAVAATWQPAQAGVPPDQGYAL